MGFNSAFKGLRRHLCMYTCCVLKKNKHYLDLSNEGHNSARLAVDVGKEGCDRRWIHDWCWFYSECEHTIMKYGLLEMACAKKKSVGESGPKGHLFWERKRGTGNNRKICRYILVYKSQQDTHVTEFILSDNCCTCFGRHYHPSSGAQNNWIYSIWCQLCLHIVLY